MLLVERFQRSYAELVGSTEENPQGLVQFRRKESAGKRKNSGLTIRAEDSRSSRKQHGVARSEKRQRWSSGKLAESQNNCAPRDVTAPETTPDQPDDLPT